MNEKIEELKQLIDKMVDDARQSSWQNCRKYEKRMSLSCFKISLMSLSFPPRYGATHQQPAPTAPVRTFVVETLLPSPSIPGAAQSKKTKGSWDISSSGLTTNVSRFEAGEVEGCWWNGRLLSCAAAQSLLLHSCRRKSCSRPCSRHSGRESSSSQVRN